MFGLSTIGFLVSLFIVLNVISTGIILSACIVSGRASREIDPRTEAALIQQRELATAISKLRVIDSESVTVSICDRVLSLPAKRRVKNDNFSRDSEHSASDSVIYGSRA